MMHPWILSVSDQFFVLITHEIGGFGDDIDGYNVYNDRKSWNIYTFS